LSGQPGYIDGLRQTYAPFEDQERFHNSCPFISYYRKPERQLAVPLAHCRLHLEDLDA
jgi:hypothetical protein